MKLLVVHQGALGDFVMTFPAVAEMRRTWLRLDALCRKPLGDLARKLNLIENGCDIESPAIAPLYSSHPEGLDAKTTALLQSYEQIVLFSFSRGLQENLERITGSKVLRVPPRPPPEERLHVSRFLWDRLVEAGLLEKTGGPLPPSSAALHLPQRERIRVPDSAPVLIHPGSGSRKKNWPLENFIRLEKLLRKDGLRPEYVLGPADIYLLDGLQAARAHCPPVHLVDDLLRVLSLMKASCGFIGNDSGLSHLAAVIGVPVTVVFGPSDPVRWKPLGPAVVVVRADTDCCPCHEDNENKCDSMKCFKGISPQMVYSTFRKLIKPV